MLFCLLSGGTAVDAPTGGGFFGLLGGLFAQKPPGGASSPEASAQEGIAVLKFTGAHGCFSYANKALPYFDPIFHNIKTRTPRRSCSMSIVDGESELVR